MNAQAASGGPEDGAVTASERTAALDLARRAAGQDLEAAGIPVVLALVGSGGPLPTSSDAAAVADGTGLADQARHLHRVLWPDAPPDDLFATYAVLATVGFSELHQEAGR